MRLIRFMLKYQLGRRAAATAAIEGTHNRLSTKGLQYTLYLHSERLPQQLETSRMLEPGLAGYWDLPR